MRFLAACVLVALSSLVGVGVVRADDDGLYGRFDGDLSLALGAGGGVMRVGGSTVGVVAGDLRLLFFDAAGPIVSVVGGPEAPELVLAGFELRPLFPALFLEDLSIGHEFADLLIQSVGVELAAAVAPQGGGTGVGLMVGVGLDVPVVLPSMFGHGIFLRLAARRVRAFPGDQGGPDRSVSGWTALVTLVVKGIVGEAVSAWEPPRYRP